MTFFNKVFTALLFLLFTLSCSLLGYSDLDKLNDDFNKKYGLQVDKIKTERSPPADFDPLKQVTYSTAPTTEQVAMDTAKDYYPYADIAKFGEKLPQNYLPNAEFYDQARGKSPSNSLSPNIFGRFS